MKVFIYRLALINSWALCVLEEISSNSQEIYRNLDDWVVVAVAEENKIAQVVMTNLRDCIE